MTADRVDIIDQAIDWHVRLTEAPEADWGDFVAWLEADSAHADAYDAIAMQDRGIAESRFPAPERIAANDNARTRRWWFAGGSVAAAAVAALLVAPMLSSQASAYEIATRAGERRTVTLDDGTSIEMSGGTSLKLDRANPRVATLDRGEAVFHVRHDAANPFTMTSGAVTIKDLGTVFNVASDNGQLSVAVSEGSVMVRPGSDALTLNAGDSVAMRRDGSAPVRSKVDPESVGGWRSGMITFGGQSLGTVAATIGRLYGIRVEMQGGLSNRPFTGMVRFTGAADRDIPHLAALIGATWRHDGDKWILSDGVAAPR